MSATQLQTNLQMTLKCNQANYDESNQQFEKNVQKNQNDEKIESSTQVNDGQLASQAELQQFKQDTKQFLEAAVTLSPSQINVVSLSHEKVIVEVNLKKSNEELNKEKAENESPASEINNCTKSHDTISASAMDTSCYKQDPENINTGNNCITRQTRRTLSECTEGTLPIRGILKLKTRARKSFLSESNANDEDVFHEDEDDSSRDTSCSNLDLSEKTKKSVHFNDRIYMNTFKVNASILSRKNKTLKRSLRKKKKQSLSGSSMSESSDIDSSSQNAPTQDLNISEPCSEAENDVHEEKDDEARKVIVIKPLLQSGTTFTVTPVSDCEQLSENNNNNEETKPGAGKLRQDSGYDSDHEAADEDEENSCTEIKWQEVKSKSRRRKSRNSRTEQQMSSDTATPVF